MHVTGFDFQFTGLHREESLGVLRDRVARLVASDPSLEGRVETAFGRFPKMQHFRSLTSGERDADRQAFRDSLRRCSSGTASA